MAKNMKIGGCLMVCLLEDFFRNCDLKICCIFMYQYTYSATPSSFQNLFTKLHNHERNLNYRINIFKSKGTL